MNRPPAPMDYTDARDGWRLEFPDGTVTSIHVQVTPQWAGQPGALMRLPDLVAVATRLPDGATRTATDSAVRWAIRKVVSQLTLDGHVVWALPPGTPSRAEFLARLRPYAVRAFQELVTGVLRWATPHDLAAAGVDEYGALLRRAVVTNTAVCHVHPNAAGVQVPMRPEPLDREDLARLAADAGGWFRWPVDGTFEFVPGPPPVLGEAVPSPAGPPATPPPCPPPRPVDAAPAVAPKPVTPEMRLNPPPVLREGDDWPWPHNLTDAEWWGAPRATHELLDAARARSLEVGVDVGVYGYDHRNDWYVCDFLYRRGERVGGT